MGRVEILLACCIFIAIMFATAAAIYAVIWYLQRDKSDADNIDQQNQRVSRILKAIRDVRMLDHDREGR